jgi:aldehyde dehydrogenase (NAD+)
LDLFENNIRWGIFFNAGQVCSAMSRVIVHEKRYDEVLERAHKVASSLSVNEGINFPSFGNNMGAMVSEKQRDRVENMVSKSIDEGAKIICGGHKLNREGAFFEPTVLTCSPDNSIAKEEVFGPVLSVMRFNNDEEAISISNSTDFGLVGGVFTKDLDRATYSVGKIRAGQVFINEWYAGGVETPFGGYGKSGYGREKGREALWNYVQTKNITIRK